MNYWNTGTDVPLVLTLGTFDVPHMGHAAFLRRCAALGTLLVGVNTDAFVMEYKGTLPVFSYEERCQIIQSLGYNTTPNGTAGRGAIKKWRPDYLVVGTDWLKKPYMNQIDMTPELFEEYGCSLVYVPYTDGISTTLIKERLWNLKP